MTASYSYDPFGKGLWKEVGGTRTYFLYADEGLIGEYDSTGNEIKTYGYDPGSTWTTDPLFMKVGDNYYFYQNDHLGTPQKMMGVNGGVVWEAKYRSFGEAEVDAASNVDNNLRFPGQYFDQETGLHYNLFRYYNEKIGMYLRLDPLRFSQLQIVSQSFQNAFMRLSPNISFSVKKPVPLHGGNVALYGYCLNNAINWIDPVGLLPLGSIFSRGGSKGIFSAGSGAMVGGIAGAFAGAGIGAATGIPGMSFVGAVVGGYVGGKIGGLFDSPCAGQLNCGEDDMIKEEPDPCNELNG